MAGCKSLRYWDRAKEIADCPRGVLGGLQYSHRSVWRESKKEGVEDISTWLIEDDLGATAGAIEGLRNTLK